MHHAPEAWSTWAHGQGGGVRSVAIKMGWSRLWPGIGVMLLYVFTPYSGSYSARAAPPKVKQITLGVYGAIGDLLQGVIPNLHNIIKNYCNGAVRFWSAAVHTLDNS